MHTVALAEFVVGVAGRGRGGVGDSGFGWGGDSEGTEADEGYEEGFELHCWKWLD